MGRNDPQMNLRVPMELKEKIEQAALNNGRTITAEAIYRLVNSFENEKPSTEYTHIAKSLHMILEEIQDLKKNQKK